jgi:hypothetical protein
MSFHPRHLEGYQDILWDGRSFFHVHRNVYTYARERNVLQAVKLILMNTFSLQAPLILVNIHSSVRRQLIVVICSERISQ